MISYINIKNIALIRELTLNLKQGLNVLSGETGAGKSIIIDSLNFVLGDRADRTLIRHGENSARVEVIFDGVKNRADLSSLLDNYGIEYEDNILIISRLMTNDKSECRINGHVVNLNMLRNIVSLLVDIHTQNEHQILSKVSSHIKLLDNYTSNLSIDKEYFSQLLVKYKSILTQIDNFSTQEERARRIDLYTYQIEEIQKINVKENEEEELHNKRNKYYNAQKIFTNLTDAINNIEGYDNYGGNLSLKQAYKNLNEISKYDDSLDSIMNRLDSCIIELADICDNIKDKIYDNENNNIDITLIEQRINDIKSIKRKYGKEVSDINSYLNKIQEELDILLVAENAIEKLNAQKTVLEAKLIENAIKLHNIREKSAMELSRAIQSNLRQLGMKNSIFEIELKLSDNILEDMNENGASYVEFMLSPNLGEPLKPLNKIASGGEMSRFMLALKNVIAETDGIDTLIFDEIDTGISGNIAKVVAQKLYDIAKNRQVIAITHLPQLASMADVNYLIEKKVEGEKTLTFIKELDGEDIYKELMRLSGAVENSAVGFSSAKELKEWANSYKTS